MEGVIFWIGVVSLSYCILRVINFIYPYCTKSDLSKYKDEKRDNWGLITGASDGIGLGFAQELSKEGFNVVLHGRNKEKLEGVMKRLIQEFPQTKYRVLIADASSNSTSFDQLAQSVSDINLKILINNVGGASMLKDTYQQFDQYKSDEIDSVIATNLSFPTYITHALIPQLKRNSSTTTTNNSTPSLIINIGSAAARGMPYISVYAPAKAFNLSWSTSLTLEMSAERKKNNNNNNIEVIGIIVGKVSTNALQVPVSLFVPNARTMARAALDRVGCGKAVITGYFPHAIQVAGLNLLPEFVAGPILCSTMQNLAREENAKKKLN